VGYGGGIGGALSQFGSAKSGVFTTLSSFRSSLFSPIYGILTTVTKIIKSVTGNISAIISSFTDPVNTILRDIKGIANQAVSVVKLLENSVAQIVNIPLQTLNSVRDTITTLKKAKGVITHAPETIAQSIRRLAHVGILNGGAAFLNAGGKKPGKKIALLNSGRPFSPSTAAKIR
jgi:phage-related protein